MDEQTTLYIGSTSFIAILIILNSGSFGDFWLIAVALSMAVILVIFLINYADYVLFPIFTIVTGIKISPARNYYIPRTANAVVKYTNGLYYATGYLSANVYNYVFSAESIDTSEDAKLGEAPDKWERIVMNANFPFRFNFVSVTEDVQTYREELEGIRGTYEFRLAKEEQAATPSELTMEDLRRKMSVVDARLSRLGAGERPVNSIMYIESTAVGVSEKEAMDALNNQLNNLRTLFGLFDLSINRIIGREVYHLFSFNYSLPEQETLTTIFSTQR